MRKDAFLWLWLGFLVCLAIGASIAWYANWAEWVAYVLTLVIYTLYLIGYFWFTRE